MPTNSFLHSLTSAALLFLQFTLAATFPPSPRSTSGFPTRLVYQFPLGSWAENIAVRSNGDLLVTRADVPELYLISSPASPNATMAHLVATFPSTLATFGITEYAPDRFAVVTGNFSLTSGSTPGSYSIWSVDFTATSTNTSTDSTKSPTSTANSNSNSMTTSSSFPSPLVSKLASLPQAQWLNGITSFPLPSSSNTSNPTSILLTADFGAGVIYGLKFSSLSPSSTSSNNNNYNSYTVSTDPLLALTQTPLFGRVSVNGIHAHANYLYFTNSGTGVFGRFPISTETGVQNGPGEIIARQMNASEGFDDFALRESKAGGIDKAFLVTGGGNSVEEVDLDLKGERGSGRIVAGALNSTAIAQGTAAQFGRGEADKEVLYVTTAGGLAVPVDGDIRVGAQIVAVDMSGRRRGGEV